MDSGHYRRNARVWYPDGEGVFPLVLIVHGNYIMSRYSDPGYEYLGRSLASRGYFIASEVTEIRFIFDKTDRGEVFIDEIGMR
jgi:hypothetical protein